MKSLLSFVFPRCRCSICFVICNKSEKHSAPRLWSSTCGRAPMSKLYYLWSQAIAARFVALFGLLICECDRGWTVLCARGTDANWFRNETWNLDWWARSTDLRPSRAWVDRQNQQRPELRSTRPKASRARSTKPKASRAQFSDLDSIGFEIDELINRIISFQSSISDPFHDALLVIYALHSMSKSLTPSLDRLRAVHPD